MVVTKHVLITGGSDGLGKAVAQKLVMLGYKVTILSRTAEKTKAVAQELGCQYVVANVADALETETALKRAVQQNGDVDILINSAGTWIVGPLESNNPETIKQAIEVNTLGTIYCTRAVIPSMKRRQNGRVINVVSQAGLYGRSERSIYNASKWAITGFTKALQVELKPFHISVVGFYPGAMATGLFAKVGDTKERKGTLNPAVAADAITYLCALANEVDVPEFGIQSLDYS